jgi:hypothetical protein
MEHSGFFGAFALNSSSCLKAAVNTPQSKRFA